MDRIQPWSGAKSRCCPHTCGDGPLRASWWTLLQRCPHTCGDGPEFIALQGEMRELSPHLWGWTAGLARLSHLSFVVPTPVGMDRFRERHAAGPCRCPHTCGDGPRVDTNIVTAYALSPHLWGWTAEDVALRPEFGVVPTPVGMDRCGAPMSHCSWVVPTPVGMDRTHTASGCGMWRCPHTCGDGPTGRNSRKSTPTLSPHLWGWTGMVRRQANANRVVPTPVGMDRLAPLVFRICQRCPHTCGDGPPTNPSASWKPPLSPHLWGWTASCPSGGRRHRVVPTPVGMDRNGTSSQSRPIRCPHTCGDGPTAFRVPGYRKQLSPHLWGWTGSRERTEQEQSVVPTPVGMDRDFLVPDVMLRRCPHTCGDGP